jgi:hypothetical protein
MASMTPDKAVDVYPASASDRPLRAPRTGQRGTRSRHSERGLASVSLVSQGDELITSARQAAAVCDFERLGKRVIPLGESPHASSNASPNSRPPAKSLLNHPIPSQRTVAKLFSSHMGEARNAERRSRRPSARRPRRSQPRPSISDIWRRPLGLKVIPAG